MADIKTRDVIKGTIKSLDRSASAMHRMKETAIRTKKADTSRGQDNDSSGSYAQNHAELYAENGTIYAVRTGADMMRRSRERNPAYSAEEEIVLQNHQDMSESSYESAVRPEQIRRPYRKQDVNDIPGRRSRSKMFKEEPLRNAEERKFTREIRNVSTIRRDKTQRDEIISTGLISHKPQPVYSGHQKTRSVTGYHPKARVYAVRRTKPQASENRIISSRRRLAMNRILDMRKDRQLVVSLFRPVKARTNKSAMIGSAFMKYLWRNARTHILTICSGSTAAVIIVTMLVFFGIGAISFSESWFDGDPSEMEFFMSDYSGSPTRYAIVKAAARELGNIGGEKFWRWFGFTGHIHWCACFTAYIADECGCIDSGICPRSALVDEWYSFYKNQHRWAGRNYSPRSGDFILFDWEGDGDPDHIGIVESCDGKTVHTIEGNSGDVCRRSTYSISSRWIFGYGVPAYSSFSGFDNACTWAAMIAGDDSYHYVRWVGGDSKTHECPVCHDHPTGSYRGWNCIGFSFACWKHGAGINCRCSCGVIDNGAWIRLLTCSTDAEANKLASRLVGVPCTVIRNGGNAIPLDKLRKGDIISLYNGSGYYHTIFYEGNGKYADCTSGRSDNIQAGNTLPARYKSQIKIAIRYIG